MVDGSSGGAGAGVDGTDAADVEGLNKLQQIVRKHMLWRVKRGGFMTDQPAFGVKVDPNPLPLSPPEAQGGPLKFTYSEAGLQSGSGAVEDDDDKIITPGVTLDPNQTSHLEPASVMVSECMILAGRIAAKYCHDNKVPAVYRGQAEIVANGAEQKLALDVAKGSVDPVSGVLPFEAFRTMLPMFPGAVISMEPVGHSTMGIPGPIGGAGTVGESEMAGYVKVTSPLRRYKDMMMHWMIKAKILERAGKSGGPGSRMPFRVEDVERISGRLHAVEKRTGKVSDAAERYWSLEWVRRREVLWRAGFGQDVVDTGVGSRGFGFGIRMPAVSKGPRSATVWSQNYIGRIAWVDDASRWEVPSEARCQKPVYQVVLTKATTTGGALPFGILGDLGGLQARFILKRERREGDAVVCEVETVDPAAGILIVAEV
ncbi:hypothetical protein HDU76_000774 [Blyttiomyces sp. JEL0837]|nr:hypothetical protein HDU76_000774 [Blyttiomyces sp. JEL0837]